MNLHYVAVINWSLRLLATLRQKFIHRSCGIILHEGVLFPTVWCLSYYREKEERKGLEVPCKYYYYCGPTKDPELIRDPAIIFVIMLFPPATK